MSDEVRWFDPGKLNAFRPDQEADINVLIGIGAALAGWKAPFLTSSLRTPKFFVKEFSYFLMPCHQHGLHINLLVQR